MQRLIQISLTDQDKEYLRGKAHDSVRRTAKDHESYLGLILL